MQHLVELGYSDPVQLAAERQRAAEALERSLREAGQLASAGRVADAVALLNPLAQREPASPRPRQALAQANLRAGDVEQALVHLRWLEIHGYEHAEFALMRAAIALQRRELDEALDQAQYALHLQQPLPAADVIRGEVQFRRGDLREAEEAYRRALDADSRCAAALAGMAAVALRRGDCESSVDWALRAIEVAPREPSVHYRLGWALARMGRREEAVAALRQAAKLGPHLAGPHRSIARLCAGVDEPGAAVHARMARAIVASRRGRRRCVTPTAIEPSAPISAPSCRRASP